MTKRSKIGDLAEAFELEASKASNEEALQEGVATAPQPTDDRKRVALVYVAVERTGPFNYEQITPEHRRFLLDRQTAIGRILGTAVIEAGRELLLARDLIIEHYGRGSWTAGLQTALSFSEQTARNYMGAAKWYEKTPTVGVLPPGALYLGANAPADVQSEILRLIENGTSVAATDIKEMIKEYRAANIDVATEAVITNKAENFQGSPQVASSVAAYRRNDDTVVEGARREIAVAKDLEVEQTVNDPEADPAVAGIPLAVATEVDASVQIDFEVMRSERNTAAQELIARLSDHFDKNEIYELDRLWQVAGPAVSENLRAS